MPTWQIFSDGTNNFRWEISSQKSLEEEQCGVADQNHADTHRLPSMADLLLQGSYNLVEKASCASEKQPLFRTGLGKSVALKQSSIARARAVLGDVDDALCDAGRGQLDRAGNGHAVLKSMSEMDPLKPVITVKPGFQNGTGEISRMPNTMFQTGSGKTVSISSSGLLRAKALLGLDEGNDLEPLVGSSKQIQMKSIHTGMDTWKNHYSLDTGNLTKLNLKPDTHGNGPSHLPEFMNTSSKQPPIKFQTAGGRSISVSSDAIKRARSLLGDMEVESFLNEVTTADPEFPSNDIGKLNIALNSKGDFSTPFVLKKTENGVNSSKNFTSPLRSSAFQKQPAVKFEKLLPRNNLIMKFDAEAANTSLCRLSDGGTLETKGLKENCSLEKKNHVVIGDQLKNDSSKRPSKAPLADITNMVRADQMDERQLSFEKKRLRRFSSISPFKKPRSSFVTPLNKNKLSITNATSRLAPEEPCHKESVCKRYPFNVRRPYIKEYVLQPPSMPTKSDNLPELAKIMNPVAAGNHRFQNETTSECIGSEAFYTMLFHSGASAQYLTNEWVSNHYKWIVWKLASYERCYPVNFSGKLLNVSNVLEELRYRYEREVNHGHRSAIRKILDGDVPPSSMMVLCISSLGDYRNCKFRPQSISSNGDGIDRAPEIELTDGWYSIRAVLDDPLSQKLATGKLFVGQKLRIWGAKLCGWIGPISPFEESQSCNLLLNANGTYRCHWAERLGFCKYVGAPLAFRCIKGTGGQVPCTLAGITKIYPVLYRERLSNGSFIVRSERLEAKAIQLYNKRRDVVAEEVESSFQKETEYGVNQDHESEEGAKLMKLLETTAEPEVLMAGMSTTQLSSFASYQAKLEATRQQDMQRSMKKAMETAGLSGRDVIPFLRVRVVGLTNKCHQKSVLPHDGGLITIWNPTQKQTQQLREGQAYAIEGLVPSTSNAGVLYLQARGSTSKWLPLSPSTMENFAPFFTPRSSVTISSLGKVPLSSEFDTAALVVCVGEAYTQGHQQKQWVFVTDGSAPLREPHDALLAISFSLPCIEFNCFEPLNSGLAGSVVGFSNLIKRPRDKVNGLWVAEATENSDYFLSYDQAGRNHLKDVAAQVSKWAKTSTWITKKLEENVMSIIRNSKDGF